METVVRIKLEIFYIWDIYFFRRILLTVICAVAVVFSVIIFCISCLCCSCCPWYRRRHQGTVYGSKNPFYIITIIKYYFKSLKKNLFNIHQFNFTFLFSSFFLFFFVDLKISLCAFANWYIVHEYYQYYYRLLFISLII